MSHNCHAVIDVVDREVPIWDELPELGTRTKADVVYCDEPSPYIRPNPFGTGVVRYCDEHVKIYDEALFELADETTLKSTGKSVSIEEFLNEIDTRLKENAEKT